MSTHTILRYITLSGIFLVPFVVLVVAESLFFPFITGKNFAFRIIVEIMTAAWLLLALLDTKYRPQFSWIAALFVGLLVVMFFADAFGPSPLKSFWSNFERMEGYITLVHVFLYMIVVGSVIHTEKLWNALFNTTLGIALLLTLYALAQVGNIFNVSQGTSWRVDGTLGNSTYMAVYMLFHIFIAALMTVRTKIPWMRYVYGGLIVLFIFILAQTGTRGAILGLAGGTLLAAGYIALFMRGNSYVRNSAIGVVAVVILFASLLFVFRDSSVVENDPRLNRITEISLDAGSTRFAIWSLAWEGFKERPILGWGQENFSYVFNKYYTPNLYGQEPWFDRVHNIVLDWLIAGGILGFLFYFGVLTAAVVYLVVMPLLRKDMVPFSVAERGIIFGLLAAYTFHNLFVFDNIVSYIFYGLILAFIHQGVSRPIQKIAARTVDPKNVEQVIAPIVLVFTLGLIYVLHVPNILAARDVIVGLTAPTVEERLAAFNSATDRHTFALQEIREQLILETSRIIQNPNVPMDAKQVFAGTAHEEIQQQIEDKPGDARVHTFGAILYRALGNHELELQQLAVARTLSPNRQQFMFEEAFAYIQQGNPEKALPKLQVAFELAPEKMDARIFYAIGALYMDAQDVYESVIDTDARFAAFASNDVALRTLYDIGKFSLLATALEYRVAQNPNDKQSWVNLGIAYYEEGDVQRAMQTIEHAIELDPTFESQGRQMIKDMQAGTL